jgi:hypothetical protein
MNHICNLIYTINYKYLFETFIYSFQNYISHFNNTNTRFGSYIIYIFINYLIEVTYIYEVLIK